MPDDVVRDLLQRSGISFIGTVQQLGAATMSDLPVDDRTAVVLVESVLHAPAAFSQLAGSQVTVQLAANAPRLTVGDRYAFFANALAFGVSLAVSELGRLPTSAILPHLMASRAATGETPIGDIQAQLETQQLQQHADDADAVVVGQVSKLERARPGRLSEHDPDWWLATLEVHHAERGNIAPGHLTLLYANSLDVSWRAAPKPRAGQSGLWLLHATEGDLRGLAQYFLPHPEDYQPLQSLDQIRAGRAEP